MSYIMVLRRLHHLTHRTLEVQTSLIPCAQLSKVPELHQASSYFAASLQ